MITEIAEPTALYRFFDGAGQLLYVGITRNPESRFAAHAREKALTWWPRAARHTVEWFETRRIAADAEAAAIATEQPIHNLSRNPAAMLTETRNAPMVGFTEIAKRLSARGIVEKPITRQGVRHIAETDPAWPIPPEQ